MAITKNALVRYQTLDRCFRNPGRRYFIQDLLDECNKALLEIDPDCHGIQLRQLYDDIKFMESPQGWSIPLKRARFGKKTYYVYEDLNFSVNNQPLNEVEAEQIKSALVIISRFSGTPQFEWVHEIIPKLQSKFGLDEINDSVINFESNVDLKGSEFLTPLFHAINNKRVLMVKYKSFNSPEPFDIAFHPYYLKQYNNRWFVFGLNQDNDHPQWNLALDRIQDINETDYSYQDSKTNWEDYFYDLIGVTRPEDNEIQEVELFFSPGIAPYIITKPIHPSQKEKNGPDGLHIRIKVIPNYELKNLLVGFGDAVEVLSPKFLRNEIRDIHKRAVEKYKG